MMTPDQCFTVCAALPIERQFEYNGGGGGGSNIIQPNINVNIPFHLGYTSYRVSGNTYEQFLYTYHDPDCLSNFYILLYIPVTTLVQSSVLLSIVIIDMYCKVLSSLICIIKYCHH